MKHVKKQISVRSANNSVIKEWPKELAEEEQNTYK